MQPALNQNHSNNRISNRLNHIDEQNEKTSNIKLNKLKTRTWSKPGNGIFSSFNSSSRQHRSKPAELYRTDFITAMKLPDTEVLDEDAYWLIKDTWKIDWEKGVQVPVKPDALNVPNFVYKSDQNVFNPSFNSCSNLNLKDECDQLSMLNNSITLNHKIQQKENKHQPTNASISATIKMPKKYLCPIQDKNYQPAIHESYITHTLLNENANNKLICKYDCDEMDMCWINRINYEFQLMGIEQLTRVNFERLIENFEQQAFNSIKSAADKLQSYSIEYDEGVVCDVCRSPDSEDTNEMVFCDGCNMCVHQACYGIEKIPQGNWLCAPCSFGGSSFKPECVLCPNIGGAMKATKNFRHWCHVSCVLWIPDTGFGNPDKMEPVINLNQVASYRWHLICNLCKEKRGCCIQCSEKRCHCSFHVTCAFKSNLEMENSLSQDTDDIVFKAYCRKHSKKKQQERLYKNTTENDEDDLDDEENEKEKPNCQSLINSYFNIQNNDMHSSDNMSNLLTDSLDDQSKFLASLGQMSETERKIEIIKRIQLLNARFYEKVSIDEAISVLNSINFGFGTGDISNHINKRHAEFVFTYWKLKRRLNITPTSASSSAIPITNKALMFPKGQDELTNQTERILLSKVHMFILLRQNLERVRTLSYMVAKREKLKKQFFDINHLLFLKQVDYLSKYSNSNDSPTNSSKNVSTSLRSGRLRDILQIKNESCIYDFPSMWSKNNETLPTIYESTDTESIKQESFDTKNNQKKSLIIPFKKTQIKNLKPPLKEKVHKVNQAKEIGNERLCKRIMDKYKNFKTKKLNKRNENSTKDRPEKKNDKKTVSPKQIEKSSSKKIKKQSIRKSPKEKSPKPVCTKKAQLLYRLNRSTSNFLETDSIRIKKRKLTNEDKSETKRRKLSRSIDLKHNKKISVIIKKK